jgi:hypothetical protein
MLELIFYLTLFPTVHFYLYIDNLHPRGQVSSFKTQKMGAAQSLAYSKSKMLAALINGGTKNVQNNKKTFKFIPAEL